MRNVRFGSGAVFSNRVTAFGSDGYFRRAPDSTWPFRNKCDYRCLRGDKATQLAEIAERNST